MKAVSWVSRPVVLLPPHTCSMSFPILTYLPVAVSRTSLATRNVSLTMLAHETCTVVGRLRPGTNKGPDADPWVTKGRQEVAQSRGQSGAMLSRVLGEALSQSWESMSPGAVLDFALLISRQPWSDLDDLVTAT